MRKTKEPSFDEVRLKLDNLQRKTVYEAFSKCNDAEEIEEFINDLMSESEIVKIKERWFIAQNALYTGCSARNARKYQEYYYDKSSQGQVSRVYKELIQQKEDGYRLVYKRFFGLPADEMFR